MAIYNYFHLYYVYMLFFPYYMAAFLALEQQSRGKKNQTPCPHEGVWSCVNVPENNERVVQSLDARLVFCHIPAHDVSLSSRGCRTPPTKRQSYQPE